MKRQQEVKARRLVWYETEVRFIIVLLVLFLLLLNQSYWTISNRLRRELENEIINDLEKVASLLRIQLFQTLNPEPNAEFTADEINRINEMLRKFSPFGIDYKVTVFDRTDQIVAPRGRPRMLETRSLRLSSLEWARLEQRATILSLNLSDAPSPIASIVIGLTDSETTRGALRVERTVYKLAFITKIIKVLYVTRIISIITALVLTVAYIRFVMLPFRIITRKARAFLTQRSEVQKPMVAGDGVRFVIETFEQTINSLEEKEHQLEELYLKAQQRVSEVETYNQYILQSINHGVITLNSEGVITTFNRFAEVTLATSGEAALSKSGLKTFGEDHPLWRLYLQCLAEHQPQSLEWRRTEPAGEVQTLALTASLLRDYAGALLGVIIVFTDQTQHRQLLERIREKRHLESIGEMSAGIAHELRNPLAAMAGYVNLIHKYTTDNDKLSSYLSELKFNIHQMERIIRDFLNFARPALPHISSIELTHLVPEIVEQVLRSSAKSVAVEFQLAGTLTIEADAHLLSQAFHNLILNAVEAMDESSGKLLIKGGLVETFPKSVWLEFIDSGSGINPALADKVFEPFFTTKSSGSGLGLAIVKRIILNHNGEISVLDPPPGWGARVRVLLPLVFTSPDTHPEAGETRLAPR